MSESAMAIDPAAALGADPAAGVLPIVGTGIRIERDGRTLVDGIDITFDGVALTAVVGPNGAGKSLLLRVLANLYSPDRGRVTWAGARPDRARAPRIGFVFQKPVMLRRSALANVAYALAAVGVRRPERAARALDVLARAGLSHLARTPARLLSAGEQQRLAIVRALATGPQALVLDEPTANLDPASTLEVERLMARARAAGTKVVLVTHDLAQVRRLAEVVVFMHRGRLDEQGPARAFLDAPASDAGRAFVDGRIVL